MAIIASRSLLNNLVVSARFDEATGDYACREDERPYVRSRQMRKATVARGDLRGRIGPFLKPFS